MKTIRFIIGSIISNLPLIIFILWAGYICHWAYKIIPLSGTIIFATLIAIVTNKWRIQFNEWFDSHLKDKEDKQ
jgi:uncharacterized membrane protein YdjX (TVP38/TMEM64 family)